MKNKELTIPPEIWGNNDLTHSEKCLLAVVMELSDPDTGWCGASNTELAERMGMQYAALAQVICRTRKRGYIKNVFFDGKNRTISVNLA